LSIATENFSEVDNFISAAPAVLPLSPKSAMEEIAVGGMTMTDATTDRIKKERSPSFPFISLAKAIDRAQQMLASHRRSPARPAVVGDTWGYSQSSSGFIQTIAALKAYGLLEDIGRGEDRRIQLSDLALRILGDARPGARENAIREAAVTPKLMKEFIGIWLPEKPNDAHRISDLTLDHGFTPDAAKTFLRIFDENVAFANLNGGDKTPDILQEADLEPTPEQNPRPPIPVRSTSVAAIERTSPTVRGTPTATLPLPEGLVSLAIPTELSERSVKLLRAWVDVMIDVAKRDVEPSQPSHSSEI
jgi:hypothetical protein